MEVDENKTYTNSVLQRSSQVHPQRTSSRNIRRDTNLAKFARLAMRASIAAVAEFAQQKICEVFVPEKKIPDKCMCGLYRDKHGPLRTDVKNVITEWSSAECTRKADSQCYGEIKFMGHESELRTAAKYMRVTDDVNTKELVDYMERVWQMRKPTMVISITGGASDFALSKTEIKGLKTGLTKVASSKGAWIVTGGTNSGIMKITGEAISDYFESRPQKDQDEIVVIGVATWGAVQSEAMMPPGNVAGRHCANYTGPDDSVAAPLDPHHSHFILVDDGSWRKFGREQGVRGAMEKHICMRGMEGNREMKVPIVCVMVEGGPGTLDTAKNALINKTPVVVVDGTGRAADALAFGLRINFSSQLNEGERKRLREFAVEKLKLKPDDEDNIKKNLGWIEECLKYRQLITVFKLGSDDTSDIDKAILQTLLEKGDLDMITKLKLALTWNRPDLAKGVFSSHPLKELTDTDITDFFTKALIQNKFEFVKLLVEQNVNLQKVVTEEKLISIYNTSKKALPHSFVTKLMYQIMPSEALKRDFTIGELSKALAVFDIIYEPMYKMTTLPNGQKEKVLSSPERELFVYSLLFGRDMASIYFWKDMTNKIASALYACIVIRKMTESSVMEDESVVQTKLLTLRSTYEDYAISVLNECSENDPIATENLLLQEQRTWRTQTCLDLALKADSKRFLAQSGCQTLFLQLWMGKLRPYTSFFLIYATVFLPFLIYFIKFINDEDDYDQEISTTLEIVEEDLLSYDTSKVSQKSPIFKSQSLTNQESGNNVVDSTFQRRYKELGILQRIKIFYTVPVTVFAINLNFTLLFLGSLSFLNIRGFEKGDRVSELSILEIVLMIWVVTIMIDEIRQLFTASRSRNFATKVKAYLENGWNITEIFATSIFTVGFLIRLVGHFVGNTTFSNDSAHAFYVIAQTCFFLRLTHVFALSENLGPKIIMIGKMMTDLRFFLIILGLFLVAYGVAVQALVYPGQTNASNITGGLHPLFWGILVRPYFQMYGELFVEDIGLARECDAESMPYPYNECPETHYWKSYVAIMFQALYMLITNVLLLNLLIAMFNYTFSRVHGESNFYWKYQRFGLIKEFYQRPLFPPPLIIISHVKSLIRGIVKKDLFNASRIKRDFNEDERKQLDKWEDLNAKEVLHDNERKERGDLEHKIKALADKTETVEQAVQEIKKNVELLATGQEEQHISETLHPIAAQELSYLPLEIEDLRKRLDRISEQSKNQLETLKDKNDALALTCTKLQVQNNKITEQCEEVTSLLKTVLSAMTYQPPTIVDPDSAER